MVQHIQASGCTVIAVDNSEDMLVQSKANIASHHHSVDIQFQCTDIRDTAIENASVVVLNYTLQFLPVDDRENLLQKFIKV